MNFFARAVQTIPKLSSFPEGVVTVSDGDRSVIAAYVLKALLDPATPAPSSDTAKELFVWVSARLEMLFRGA